jgi:YggT family protein
MSTERHEQVKVERGDGFERRQRVVAFEPSTRVILVSRISKFIWLLTGILDVLIAFRFVLKMIAANPGNGFADFIYGLTNFFVSPFLGLVNTPVGADGSMVEIGSLFAIVFYTLVAAVIIQLMRILFAGTGGSKQVTTVERHD